MHSILSNSTYSRLNWTWSAVEQDFLEVPSVGLENWLYFEEVGCYLTARCCVASPNERKLEPPCRLTSWPK